MRCRSLLFGFLLLLGFLPASARVANATVIADLFNTGVDAFGTPLADQTVGDPHYVFTSDASGSGTMRIRSAVGGAPIPPWIGDNAISAWIGPNTGAQLTGPVGFYIYETTFTLPANADLNSVIITGQWAADDSDAIDQIHLNGPATIALGNGGPAVFTPFSVGPGAGSLFVTGINVLHFITRNTGAGTSTGLRVEMVGDFSVVPEPGTFCLAACGALALALLGIRKRRP